MAGIRNALIFMVFLAVGGTASATDLVDVLSLGLTNDPLLREAEATRLAALQSKPLARSGLLPQINLSGQFDDQDSEGTFTTFIGQLVTTDRASDAERDFWSLQLTQPVFRWDRWIALKRADKTIAQAEADYLAARQNMALRVTQSYFAVLAARDRLQAEQANKEAIARQLEQAETRFEVGLIAITDVHESRAAYDQSVAAEIAAKRTLAVARENLREIVGESLSGLADPKADMPLVNPDPADPDRWVSQAMESNAALESSRLGVEIASDDVKTERTGHYPTLDLVVSRSEFSSDGTQFDTAFDPITGQPRTSGGASQADNTTDTIALQFNVPIYSGGGVSAQVRQAVYRQRAARERLERVARQTERETRDAYLGVISDVSRVSALKEAVVSSETALRATEAGFDVGTRTSVDVLNARRDLLQAETNYRAARYDYIVNIVRLKLAAGTLTEADIREINSWLSE